MFMLFCCGVNRVCCSLFFFFFGGGGCFMGFIGFDIRFFSGVDFQSVFMGF